MTEAKAKEIAALLDLGRFDWTPYSKIKRDSGEKAQTVSEWLKRFEQHYFESRPRTPAKLNTFQKNYWAALARMPGHEVLTATLIRETVLKESVAGSRNRQIFVMAYASLAKLAGIEVDLKSLKSNYSPKSISPRDLPTDEAILETIDRFSDPGWRWIYGMLATYGLRDYEVFRLDTSRMKDPPYVVEVLDDSKTGQRLVYPCPSGWAEHFQLWDVRLPKFRTQPDMLDNNALGEKTSDCTELNIYLRLVRESRFLVIAQLRGNKDCKGFNAARIASKADKPCRLPVLTIERTIAKRSLPQSERKPLVTLRNITLQRSACSLALFVAGIVASSKNRKRLSCSAR